MIISAKLVAFLQISLGMFMKQTLPIEALGIPAQAPTVPRTFKHNVLAAKKSHMIRRPML